MTITDEPPIEADHPPEAAAATPEFEKAAARAESRRGFLMALPAYLYLILFFAIPFLIVIVYSFAARTSTGGTELANWNLDSYQRLGEPIVRTILQRSLVLALVTTVLCLVLAYPFAYFIATRSPRVRNLMLVFVMIPFWTNFLVRNYAWRLILSNDGPLSDATSAVGLGTFDLLFTQRAVVLGMVYGFLPFMILPLYASIERIDLSLVEASRDLYASGWQTLRRVLIPLSMPGIIAGSILVFIPSLGAYVTPEILGGGKSVLLGSYIVVQFFAARNFPSAPPLSVVLMMAMLTATLVYFRSGGGTCERRHERALRTEPGAADPQRGSSTSSSTPRSPCSSSSFLQRRSAGGSLGRVHARLVPRFPPTTPRCRTRCGSRSGAALVSTLISVVLGTLAALSLERFRFRGQRAFDALLYLPIIIPDVTMAVMLLLFFTESRSTSSTPPSAPTSTREWARSR
ncbi:MAG: ABC transporter permease subunit [Acidimicrobiales bacterium]